MSDTIYHIPYTYLIKFKPTNQVYYGVRYAKNCHPNEFWKTYFTSSSIIHKLIEQHGLDSFDIQIRRTFDDSQKAYEWETKVLQKFDAKNDDRFLNRYNNDSQYYYQGKPLSEEHKQNISNGAKLAWSPEKIEKHRQRMLNNHPFKGKKLSQKARDNMRKGQLGSKASNETKLKMSLAKKDIPKETVQCPHCLKCGGKPAMKRWHFENCKQKI